MLHRDFQPPSTRKRAPSRRSRGSRQRRRTALSGSKPAKRSASEPVEERAGLSMDAIEELDEKLYRVARSAGALRLALAEGLEALARRGGHHELGFSSLEGYALERCERSARWVQQSRSLARRLASLPVLRQSLVGGRVSWSMASVLSSVATPSDEETWLGLARGRTVREMRALAEQRRRTSDSPDEALRSPLDAADDEPSAERFRTLTITVDRTDAWLFECARRIIERLSGNVTAEQVMEALLAEGETSLFARLHPDDITVAARDPWREAQRAWEAELARWREQAEVLCEPNFAERKAGSARPCVAVPHAGDFQTCSPSELDASLRDLSKTLARRDVDIGRLAEQLWRADGWRRLGYATDVQYAVERLGMSRSAVKLRRTLVRRLDRLEPVGHAVKTGKLGLEAALLISRVASEETAEDWTLRAGERTIKHLREEVIAAELVARMTDGPPVAPLPSEFMRELQGLEARVVSGEWLELRLPGSEGTGHACLPGEHGQMSAGAPGASVREAPGNGTDGQMSAARMDVATRGAIGGTTSDGQMSAVESETARALSALAPSLDGLVSGLESGDSARRLLARVTLRFRVREDVYWQYRSFEALYRRHSDTRTSALAFLCFALIDTWKHALRTGVAFEPIYARDLFRCGSPVCNLHHGTPHHLRYRSQGGGGSSENMLTLCWWCHLEGVHGGRLKADPPASNVHWELGRIPHTTVMGRKRVRKEGQ